MMTDDDTYNGWTNRETWAAALWLGNDEALDEMARERVAQAIEESRVASERWNLTWKPAHGMNRAGSALCELVEELLDPTEDLLVETTRRNMASDIGSLWRVDWAAVAEAFAPEPVEA